MKDVKKEVKKDVKLFIMIKKDLFIIIIIIEE
jgi:hypothetical protein